MRTAAAGAAGDDDDGTAAYVVAVDSDGMGIDEVGVVDEGEEGPFAGQDDAFGSGSQDDGHNRVLDTEAPTGSTFAAHEGLDLPVAGRSRPHQTLINARSIYSR